jgi:Tfp pilus assembly PilM family ATPase
MSSVLSVHAAASPTAAVEIAAGRVSAATLEWRGKQAVVGSYATEPLPAGALVPSLTAANVHDRPAVLDVLGRALERVGRPRRVGLVIPDVTAKVSLVKFERVPPRPQDLDQLVRWQVRKTAPFPIDEAQVSYVPGLETPEGKEFVVSLAKREVVEEYEGLCTQAGVHAGIVDLATFNVINAVLAAPSAPAGDWMLVNIAADYGSIAILRGQHLIVFRSRAAEGEGSLADLVHQTAMYYEDRLKGGGFERIVVAGMTMVTAADAAELEVVRGSLDLRLPAKAEAIDPRQAAALTDRISASPELLDALAPLVGLLLRDRDVVAA